MHHPSPVKRVSGYVRWLVRRPELRDRPFVFLSNIIKWKLITLIQKAPTVVFDGDIKMKSPHRNATASATYQLGYAEPVMFSFLASYLKEGMTFCDIGANVGAYTLFAAKKVGAKGRVIAFEPAPPTYGYLKHNIDLNNFGNVEAYNVALGDIDGTAEFAYEADDLGKSRIENSTAGGRPGRLSVQVERLDSLRRRARIGSIDYMKIDVEGFELAILLGAESTISSNKQMLIQTELLPYLHRRYGHYEGCAAGFLGSLGFIPFFVDANALKLCGFASDRNPVGDEQIGRHESCRFSRHIV